MQKAGIPAGPRVVCDVEPGESASLFLGKNKAELQPDHHPGEKHRDNLERRMGRGKLTPGRKRLFRRGGFGSRGEGSAIADGHADEAGDKPVAPGCRRQGGAGSNSTTNPTSDRW